MKQFKTESKRILDLMINSIYTNKEIFLRELISNASDAIDKLKFISLTDDNVKSDFSIKIDYDKEKKTFTVSDNGIGMTEADLEKNLGTIAESGTLAFKNKYEGTEKELIGNFGVGFYSAFMVADKIEVLTKAYKSEKAYKFTSKGVEGYEIEEAEKDDIGTQITLYVKEDTEDYKYSEFLSEYKVRSLIKKYSDYVRYPIVIKSTKSKLKEGCNPDKPEYEEYVVDETVNSMVPIWKKQKAEVSKEELNEFYKNEFKDYEEPIYSAFSKIEGTLTYDTVFFIPSRAPYDYYTKDYKRGIKLYSNGVMIMEKCEELLPDYLGFISGIVDSSDLSLNISREILQQSRQVKAISTSLEKKILSELKKFMDEDGDKYRTFFNEFGLTLKYGVYSDFGINKDKLKDLILFMGLNGDNLISLSEYVKEMPETQAEIYYACGENYDKIKTLPQIEKAKEKGVNVLLFKDNVDEFAVKVLAEYEGKKFKNVADADFSFSSEEEKKELKEKSENFKEVLEFIKDELKDKVKDVRLTDKLVSYPVCLTTDGEVSIEMEKVLSKVPNANGVKAEKVLEINANHKIKDKLENLFLEDKELLKKYAVVLFEQARLLEGLSVDDTTSFINALSDIME